MKDFIIGKVDFSGLYLNDLKLVKNNIGVNNLD